MQFDKLTPKINGCHRLLLNSLIMNVAPEDGGLTDLAVSHQYDLVLGTIKWLLCRDHPIKNRQERIKLIFNVTKLLRTNNLKGEIEILANPNKGLLLTRYQNPNQAISHQAF
jgi:hypothetical protein